MKKKDSAFARREGSGCLFVRIFLHFSKKYGRTENVHFTTSMTVWPSDMIDLRMYSCFSLFPFLRKYVSFLLKFGKRQIYHLIKIFSSIHAYFTRLTPYLTISIHTITDPLFLIQPTIHCVFHHNQVGWTNPSSSWLDVSSHSHSLFHQLNLLVWLCLNNR